MTCATSSRANRCRRWCATGRAPCPRASASSSSTTRCSTWRRPKAAARRCRSSGCYASCSRRLHTRWSSRTTTHGRQRRRYRRSSRTTRVRCCRTRRTRCSPVTLASSAWNGSCAARDPSHKSKSHSPPRTPHLMRRVSSRAQQWRPPPSHCQGQGTAHRARACLWCRPGHEAAARLQRQ